MKKLLLGLGSIAAVVAPVAAVVACGSTGDKATPTKSQISNFESYLKLQPGNVSNIKVTDSKTDRTVSFTLAKATKKTSLSASNDTLEIPAFKLGENSLQMSKTKNGSLQGKDSYTITENGQKVNFFARTAINRALDEFNSIFGNWKSVSVLG